MRISSFDKKYLSNVTAAVFYCANANEKLTYFYKDVDMMENGRYWLKNKNSSFEYIII